MNNREYDWSQPQRQSAVGLLLIFFKVIRGTFNLFLPLILLYVVKGRSGGLQKWEWLFILAPIFMLVRASLEYYYYRFYINENELIIKKGVLRKQTIALPLDKIQGVQLEQHIVHKLLNAARLGFDSAGTERMEVKIDAIQLTKAAALKAFILEKRTTGQEQAPTSYEYDENKILTLGFSDLLRLSFSANHIEAFFILLGFLFSVLENVRDVLRDRINQWVDEASGWIPEGSFSVFVVLLMLVLIISVAVSVIKTFVTYFNFFISAREKGFRIYGGLINVKEKLLPYRKIQYITWRANWIRRKIGIYLLQYRSVGSDAVKENQQVRVPVTNELFIPALINVYHTRIDTIGLPAFRINSVYAFRKMIFSGILPAVAGFLISLNWLGAHACWFFMLIPFVYLHKLIFAKRFRYYISEEAIQLCKGIWGTQHVLLRWDKIQKIQVSQGIYQRKKALANIRLHTAGGVVSIPYISYEEAMSMTNYGLYKTETDKKDWM